MHDTAAVQRVIVDAYNRTSHGKIYFRFKKLPKLGKSRSGSVIVALPLSLTTAAQIKSATKSDRLNLLPVDKFHDFDANAVSSLLNFYQIYAIYSVL